MSYTIGSLFAGIGGFEFSAQALGIECLWNSEIDQQCNEVLKKHFPDTIQLGDITKIDGSQIPPVDIITFGSPCQDLSVAGKRAGLKHEENGDDETTRSGLFLEAVKIIYEMRRATNGQYPKYAVWENVVGAFSSAKGLDFREVLRQITKIEIPMPNSGKWATAGMVGGGAVSVAWRTYDAQYWGVPQRRKRIYLVADFTGGCAAQILFKQ